MKKFLLINLVLLCFLCSQTYAADSGKGAMDPPTLLPIPEDLPKSKSANRCAYGKSADGLTAVGREDGKACLWENRDNTCFTICLSGEISAAYSITDDKTTIVGGVYNKGESFPRPCIWRRQDGGHYKQTIVRMHTEAGCFFRISADGSSIIGKFTAALGVHSSLFYGFFPRFIGNSTFCYPTISSWILLLKEMRGKQKNYY